MGDTTAAAARLQSELLMALSPERRLVMAAGMFDTARQFVLASLPDDLSAPELRIRLCERIYGEELALQFARALRNRRSD